MKLILLSLSLTFMSSATHANGFFIFSTVEKKTIPCSFKFSSNFTSKQEEQIETFFFEKGYNMNDKEEAEGVPEFLVEAASKNYSLGSEMDYHEYLITNLTSYDVVNKNILQIFDTVKGILVETLHDRSLVNIDGESGRDLQEEAFERMMSLLEEELLSCEDLKKEIRTQEELDYEKEHGEVKSRKEIEALKREKKQAPVEKEEEVEGVLT